MPEPVNIHLEVLLQFLVASSHPHLDRDRLPAADRPGPQLGLGGDDDLLGFNVDLQPPTWGKGTRIISVGHGEVEQVVHEGWDRMFAGRLRTVSDPMPERWPWILWELLARRCAS